MTTTQIPAAEATLPQGPALAAAPVYEHLTGPSALILTDSVSPCGSRLTTWELVMHRWVLAEFNTHKSVFRSAASSRAIPIMRYVENIRHHPAWPVRWQSEKRGMQGGDALTTEQIALIKRHWGLHVEDSIKVALELREKGLHKSLTNRLLEPFTYVKVVATGTAWLNFLDLRDHPDAQPELQAVAAQMRDLYNAHTPTALAEGQWHLPYVTDRDRAEVEQRLAAGDPLLTSRRIGEIPVPSVDHYLAQISGARCARTSYLTNPVVGPDGQVLEEAKIDIAKDFGLVDDLIGSAPRHWSPFEHQGTPWPQNRQIGTIPFTLVTAEGTHTFQTPTGHLPRIGGLVGWRSQRTETETILGEITFR